jgi:hypothetical protein
MSLKELAQLISVRLARRPLPSVKLAGPCVVLGSAPGVRLPSAFGDHWTLLTVNAAQAGLDRLGVRRKPDLTIMSGRMLGHKSANLEGKKVMAGRATSHLVVIERAMTHEQIRAVLEAIGFVYDSLSVIDHRQRARVTYDMLRCNLAIGSGNEKISTGVFAALLACYLGAHPVVLAGCSLARAGHSYNDLGMRRAHVEYDRRALLEAQRQQLPLWAYDPDFARESRLSQWPETAPCGSAGS